MATPSAVKVKWAPLPHSVEVNVSNNTDTTIPELIALAISQGETVAATTIHQLKPGATRHVRLGVGEIWIDTVDVFRPTDW